jgi:MFS family permease
LIIATGTVLLGTIKELWHFYVYYGLFVGSLGNAAFTVLLPVIVTRWFHLHMGVALGIYWAAMGAGPMIFAPLFRWLIETRGWEWSFTLIGIVMGGILIVFSWLIRSSPYEMGLSIWSGRLLQRATCSCRIRYSAYKSARGSVSAGVALDGYSSSGLRWTRHHPGPCRIHGTLQGVSGVEAAGVLGTVAGTSIISRFVFSVLAERLGGRALCTIALIGQSTPVLILFFANEAWVFYLFAVVFGLCYGGEMVGFPIINRQLFNAKAPLGSIYSFEMLGASTGMALGGWLGGALFDLSGAYTWSILASAVLGYLGLPLALALPRHKSLSCPRAAGPDGILLTEANPLLQARSHQAPTGF